MLTDNEWDADRDRRENFSNQLSKDSLIGIIEELRDDIRELKKEYEELTVKYISALARSGEEKDKREALKLMGISKEVYDEMTAKLTEEYRCS